MRGTGIGGGHDEREQTLNQILNEMDGFLLEEHRTQLQELAETLMERETMAADEITSIVKTGTRNPEPGTRNPEPGTRNPEPGRRRASKWKLHKK